MPFRYSIQTDAPYLTYGTRLRFYRVGIYYKRIKRTAMKRLFDIYKGNFILTVSKHNLKSTVFIHTDLNL